MTTAQADLVTIGKIERHFGVRGEFKVRSLSDVPGRLDHLKQVQVLEPTGQTIEKTVTHVRRAGSTYIMGLAGVTTPEEAGMLRGGLIQVPRAPASALSADVYFECDLIGMTVENERGDEIGVLGDDFGNTGESCLRRSQGGAGSPHSGCEELCDLGGSRAPADDGSRDRRFG